MLSLEELNRLLVFKCNYSNGCIVVPEEKYKGKKCRLI